MRSASLWSGIGGLLLGLAAPGPVVRLPTYTVTEPRLLPKPESWKYGQVPGFEILSDASDGETKRMIADFLLFQRAVGAIWPEVSRNFDLPVSLILCRDSGRFARFMPPNMAAPAASTYSLSLRDRELAAIIINLAAANPPGGDIDSGAGESLAEYGARILRGEYVHFLLSRIDPPPPAWLEAGLGHLLLSMSYQGDLIAIPALPDAGDLAWRKDFAAKAKAAAGGTGAGPPAAMGADKNLQTALSAGAFMPLPKLFAEKNDGAVGAEADSPWDRECDEFVHFCLFADDRRWTKGLLRFSVEASLQPPDEGLFRRCFGIGTDEMLLRLWAYTGYATPLGFSIQPADGRKPSGLPVLALREATDAESGRIMGDALRMAGRPEAAHYRLIAPYLRGSRDPQLLAALGLEESAAGRTDRAIRFLIAATDAGTTRARAYYELARLRFDADLRASRRRLSVDEMVGILKPLWAARSHPPPLPEVYALFAQAWSRAGFKPAKGNLAVIDEGVRDFPFDADLIYADARVRAQFGFDRDAAALANHGLEVTRGEAQARFSRLKASLRQ